MEFLKKYLSNEVFRASIALLFLSNFASFINFVFQFIMARMLDSDNFGILAFVTSLLFIFGVPSLAIQTSVSKRTTKLNMDGKTGKIRGLFEYATKKLVLVSAALIVLFIIASYFMQDFLKIPFWILAVSSIAIVFSLILPVIMGIMQGMKKFMAIGWNNVLNYSIKLVFGVVLVYFGFRIYGALIGILLGMFVAWIIASLTIVRFKSEKEEINLFSKEEILPFIALLIITLMYSLDIVIGKFVFSPEILGSYAKISLIGKIILFSCSTVSLVMFPISSEKHMNGDKSKGVIKKASMLVALICFFGLLAAYFFPNFIISLLFGAKYAVNSSLLFPVCIAFASISCLTLLVMYKISVNNFSLKESCLLSLMLIVQISSLIFFSKEIMAFALAFMATSLLSFILLFLFTIKWKKSA